ncbi:MAG TPA: OmpA family protein [Blastocatellia bacterium]|nr:OmpA family protein [Blastocatellia bacterium]
MNDDITAWLKTIALAIVVLITGIALASASPAQDTSGVTKVQPFASGQTVKTIGIVLKRDADSFVMREQTGMERAVALTARTEVKTHKKGVFRGGKTYGVSYILRGLRLEVTGAANSQGQLVADSIKFDEDDLRTAQALEARVDPVEELAKANRARILAAEEEARRLSRESEENAAAARKAQATADEARRNAERANNRINGLDDYDPVKTITVLFATGSPALGPKGKAGIDAAAAWVKTQDRKGWVVAVIGFADTTGNTAANRKLSERRANAVIGYLVTKHNLPLQRLVQPFGYGDLNPVAENTTAEGRSKNRRVEIRLLQNKGIADTVE